MAAYDIVAANRAATQTGASLGATIAQNFYRQQEQGIRMQQLQSERAMQQLQERQLAQNLALQMENHDRAVQERADLTKAQARMQVDMSQEVPFIGPPEVSGNTPSMVPNPHPMLIEDAYAKHVLPVLLQYHPEKQLDALADIAAMKRARREELRATEVGPGNIQSIQAPDGGQFNVYVPPAGRGANQLVGESTPQIIEQGGRQFIRNKDGTLKPLAATPGAVGERMTKQKMLAEALKVDPSQVDANGNLTPEGWSAVQRQSQITTATRTNLEKQELEIGRVFELGQEMADLLTFDNVGPKGNLTRIAEGFGAALVPGFKIGRATDVATLAQQYKSALTRTMRSDGNIAEPEREAIEKAVPDPTSWSKGVPQAKSSLATTLEQWGHLSRKNAEMRGKPIFPAWLTLDEVANMLQRGDINEVQAENLMKDNGWNLINKLRQSALKDAKGSIPNPRQLDTSLKRRTN